MQGCTTTTNTTIIDSNFLLASSLSLAKPKTYHAFIVGFCLCLLPSRPSTSFCSVKCVLPKKQQITRLFFCSSCSCGSVVDNPTTVFVKGIFTLLYVSFPVGAISKIPPRPTLLARHDGQNSRIFQSRLTRAPIQTRLLFISNHARRSADRDCRFIQCVWSL